MQKVDIENRPAILEHVTALAAAAAGVDSELLLCFNKCRKRNHWSEEGSKRTILIVFLG